MSDRARIFREALRYLTDTSVEKVAKAAGFSRQAFDQYLNQRPASASAARALVKVLRVRARRLERFAERLERSGEGPGDGPK